MSGLTSSSGGTLRPGLTLAYNGTGRDERGLTDPRDAAQRGGVVVTGNTSQGYTAAEVATELHKSVRHRQALRPAVIPAA